MRSKLWVSYVGERWEGGFLVRVYPVGITHTVDGKEIVVSSCGYRDRTSNDYDSEIEAKRAALADITMRIAKLESQHDLLREEIRRQSMEDAS